MSHSTPNAILERELRRAILASLHTLVPEFRSHVVSCTHCHEFHDWIVWRHREGTTEWAARCPHTGEDLVIPLVLPVPNGGTEGTGDESSSSAA
jgi:hypothetical protein